MVFGELIDVMTCREPVPLGGEGVDRYLNHVLVGQQVVEQPQLHRRDDILGVMQDETGELDPRIALEAQDRVDDVVQAVGLAGGAGAGTDDFVNVGIMQAHRIDIGLGLRVVGVGADKNLVVLVIEGGGCQARHLANDAHFVPGRHHDCQRFFRYLEQAALVGARIFVIDAKASYEFAQPIDQVDEQIVEPEQEHQAGQYDGKQLEAEQHVGQGVDQAQAHDISRPLALSSSQRLSRSAMRSLACPSP